MASSTRFSLCLLNIKGAPLDNLQRGSFYIKGMPNLKHVLQFLPGIAAQVASRAVNGLGLGWGNDCVVSPSRGRVLH